MCIYTSKNIYIYIYIYIYIFKKSCEIEGFFETYLCKLWVMFRSRVLRVLYGLMEGMLLNDPYIYEEDKSEAAEFKEWVCLYLGTNQKG